MDYPGPYCQSVDLNTNDVETRTLTKVKIVSNGLVLELKDYAEKKMPNNFGSSSDVFLC